MQERIAGASPGRQSAMAAALLAVLAAAVALRFHGIAFGLPLTQARPDESRIINVAVRIATGDLNPHYFVYPTLYMYLLAAVLAVQALARGAASVAALPVPALFLAGRCLTAVLGSLSVWCVYQIALRAAAARAALAAAALLAVAFLHVRDSHFATTDVPMTCGVLLALLLLIRARQRTREIAIAGLVAGLATSVKYNAVLLAPVAAVVELHDAFTGAESWPAAARRLVLFGAAMTAGFLIGTPFALIDRADFIAAIRFVSTYLEAGHTHAGRVLAQPHAAWWYATRTLPQAVGWPVLAAGVAGMVLLLRSNLKAGLACVTFPILYFLTAARGETVFARYMIPVVPFLCLGGGHFVAVASGAVRHRVASAFVAAVLFVALAVPTAIKTVELDRLLSVTDSRIIAAAWIDAHHGSAAWCETGSVYGRPHPDRGAALDCPDRAGAVWPAYVVVQRSPLSLYSELPASAELTLSSLYVVVQSFRTGAGTLGEDDYDPADAFFVPLQQLDAIRRPGPEFDIYARRDASRAAADGSTRHE